MSATTKLLNSINASANGVSMAELMAMHPDIARRSAQRQVARLVEDGLVVARGDGRGRRYFGVDFPSESETPIAPAKASIA